MVNSSQKYSELTFQQIVESVPSAMILMNKEGEIAFVNNQFEILFGYLKSEIIGQDIEILVPGKFINQYPYHRDHFFDAPESHGMGVGRDWFAKRKDGNEFPVEIGLSPIKTSDGNMVLASVIDITQRKKYEEQISLFASIVNSSDDAIISKTLDGIIISWNDGAEKLFGYTNSEIIGKNVSILIPKDRLNEEPEIIERIRKGEFVDHYETQRQKKDGSLVYISITVSPIKDAKGKIIGASKIARDISDKKKMEKHRERSEKRFRALLENNNDAITLHDANGVVIYHSPAVERITGYTSDEIKNISAFELFHPDFVQNAKDRIQEAVKNPGKAIYGINRLKHKKGYYIWTEGTTTNLLDDENVKAMVGNFRDITERKIAEEKILKSNRLYSFLSGINQSIVHTKDAEALFNEVCRITIEKGGFEFAWIGEISESGNSINLVASFNATPIDLKSLQNAIYDPEGPTASALKKGEYYLSNNVANDTIKGKWTEYLNLRNFSSQIVLPIKILGQTKWTLNIYSKTANFFDKDQIELLLEAAGDISYALNVFEKERQISQSETRLKGAQKMAHLGDWEFNLRTQKVSWSDENFRIYGLEPGDNVPSLSLMLSFVHPDDMDRIRDEVNNSLSNFIPMASLRRIVQKGGAVRHVYATALFDFDEYDKPIRFHGTTLDVTAITQVEEELRNSETRFREFFDNAPEAITILDLTSGKFVLANNNAQQLLKYSLKELTAMGPVEVSPLLQPDGTLSEMKALAYIDAALKGGKPVFEWAVRNGDGKEIMTEARLVKLDGMGHEALMTSFVDITERKSNERLKEKMTADLVQRNKDLEQFTYIVSHNLRAPVANILGVSDILQRPDLDAMFVEKMHSNLAISVDRLDATIKDLNFILQVKREVNEKNEIVSFSKIVDDIKISISNLMKSEKAEIICDFDEVDRFFTLKSYIYSVFYNLISNSIKYKQLHIKPVIEIKSALIKDRIILTFRDNGLGIDMEKQGGQIFGLYKRFHLHTEGKGMGLFMTKTQIETMGGRISISSKVNEGTEFRIEFEIIN